MMLSKYPCPFLNTTYHYDIYVEGKKERLRFLLLLSCFSDVEYWRSC